MSGSTPSSFKRAFVGDDDGYATQVPADDLLHVAGPYGAIFRVTSTAATDTVTLSATALSSLALGLSQIYLGTLSVTEPALNNIYQRDTRTGSAFSLGAGTVPLTISATEVVTRLQYRLRNAAVPATTLVDWTELTFSRVSGAQTLSVPVPAGLYKYLIDLRPNTDAAKVVSTTNGVMMGEVRAFAGQSLAQTFIDTRPSGDTATIVSLGLSVSAWAWIWASTALNSGAVPQVTDTARLNFPVASWVQSSDAGVWDSAWAVQYQNRMIALTGVPCGLVGYAVGGTGIATWLSGYTTPGTPHWDDLISTITAAGGKFGGFLWCHGHYESKNSTTSAVYLAALQTFFAGLAAAFPSSGTFYQIIGSIPAIGAYGGSTATTVNMVRETAKDYVASVAASAHVDGLDITMVADLVHYSQAGAITFADEWFRADAKKMGLATYGNDGPLITTATRAYGTANIVLAVTQGNGGTAWVTSGSIVNQFTVYPAGTLTGALTINSVTTSAAGQLTLVLSAAPTEPAALDIWYRRSPDDATIIATTIRDNVTGDSIATGRQLALLGEATTASIPVAVITINTISGANAGTSTAITGTYSNSLPTALDYSTNGGTTWVVAPAPTIGGGTWSFTLGSGFTVGVYRLQVRDNLSRGSGTSNIYSIAQAAPATLPTIATKVFSFSMALPNAGLFTDTGLSVQAAVGDYVGSIQDRSSTSNYFIQATQANKPQFVANVKNGLPGLYFTGSLSHLLSLQGAGTLMTTLKASTGYTIFLVYTPTSLPSVAATIFAASEKAKTGGFNIIRGSQILSTTAVRSSRNSDTVYYQPGVAAAAAANQINKDITRYDSAAPTLRIKVNALVEASLAPAGLGTNAFTACYIGAEGTSAVDQFFFDGYIHQIEVWNSTASDADRDALVTYGTNQWGS